MNSLKSPRQSTKSPGGARCFSGTAIMLSKLDPPTWANVEPSARTCSRALASADGMPANRKMGPREAQMLR